MRRKQLPPQIYQVSKIVTISMGILTKISHPTQPSSTIIEITDNQDGTKKAGLNQLGVDN